MSNQMVWWIMWSVQVSRMLPFLCLKRNHPLFRTNVHKLSLLFLMVQFENTHPVTFKMRKIGTGREQTSKEANMSLAKTLRVYLKGEKISYSCHPFGRNKLNVLSTSEDVNYEEQQTIPLTSRGNLAFLRNWSKRKKAGGYLYTSNIY